MASRRPVWQKSEIIKEASEGVDDKLVFLSHSSFTIMRSSAVF